MGYSRRDASVAAIVRRRWSRILPPRSCPRCIAPSWTGSPSSRPRASAREAARVRREATRPIRAPGTTAPAASSRPSSDAPTTDRGRAPARRGSRRPAADSARPAAAPPRALTARRLARPVRRAPVAGRRLRAMPDPTDPRCRARPRPGRLRRPDRARRGDRGRVVLRQRPRRRLARAARARSRTRGPARPIDPAPSPPRRARDRRDRPRSSDPHRAIDWLSTFPQVVLARRSGSGREVPGRRPRRPRRRLCRDPGRPARRPRGRAAGRRHAGRARPGPGGHERRDHRPDGWRTMFPTLFGAARRGRRTAPASEADPRRRARGRRPRRAGPQPVPRRDRRGAHRAPARPARRAGDASAASGGSCSTACVPRSIRTT